MEGRRLSNALLRYGRLGGDPEPRHFPTARANFNNLLAAAHKTIFYTTPPRFLKRDILVLRKPGTSSRFFWDGNKS